MRKMIVCFMLIAVPFCFNCTGRNGDDYRQKPDSEVDDDDTSVFRGDDDTFIDDDNITDDDVGSHCPNEYCVTVIRDIGGDRAYHVDDPQASEWYNRGCIEIEGYNTFANSYTEYSHPIINDDLQGFVNHPPASYTGEISSEKLKQDLLSALCLDFLFDGSVALAQIPLTVKIIEEQDGINNTVVRKLVFINKQVGEFEGYSLMPKDQKNLPAILASHGHYVDDDFYPNDVFASDFASAGYAVFVPNSRILCGSPYEPNAVKNLLIAGRGGLIGARIYERFLVWKYMMYLSSEGYLDSEKFGLIGHSDGSIVNNVFLRISTVLGSIFPGEFEDFSAVITDLLATSYWSPTDSPPADIDHLSSKDNPFIHVYTRVINNLNTSSVPILYVGYGKIKDGLPFIDAHLKQ